MKPLSRRRDTAARTKRKAPPPPSPAVGIRASCLPVVMQKKGRSTRTRDE